MDAVIQDISSALAASGVATPRDKGLFQVRISVEEPVLSVVWIPSMSLHTMGALIVWRLQPAACPYAGEGVVRRPHPCTVSVGRLVCLVAGTCTIDSEVSVCMLQVIMNPKTAADVEKRVSSGLAAGVAEKKQQVRTTTTTVVSDVSALRSAASAPSGRVAWLLEDAGVIGDTRSCVDASDADAYGVICTRQRLLDRGGGLGQKVDRGVGQNCGQPCQGRQRVWGGGGGDGRR